MKFFPFPGKLSVRAVIIKNKNMDNQQNEAIESYRKIDLKNVIEIFIRRKKMIFGLALAGAAVAFLAGWQLFNYQASAVMEIGSLAMIDQENKGVSFVAVESPLAVKEKIKKFVYGIDAWGEKEQSLPEIEALYAPNTNIIQIVARSRSLVHAKKYLDTVCREIISQHQEKSVRQQADFGLIKISDTQIIKTTEISHPNIIMIAINAVAVAIFSAVLGMFLALTADWWCREEK